MSEEEVVNDDDMKEIFSNTEFKNLWIGGRFGS